MNQPHIDLIPLRAAVCSDRPTTLDLVVRIIPPDLPETIDARRPTLNVGFVIDRSGSMGHRKKIEYSRQAVCYAIEQLLPSDRLSVTIFDNHVETLIPNTPANNKTSFKRLINQIQPRGSTALHAGWVQGGIQVSQSLTAELNRVIVLSDGLANLGETNPDAIATDVHGLAQRGVSTSTMGLGDDYNEDLLEAMARSGDGNYYYIEAAEQLPSIFEQELQGLAITIGKAVTMAVKPQGDVVLADVLNDLDKDADGQYKLPNLMFGNPIDFVVRLKVPAITQEAPLCVFHLSWTDTEQQLQELTIPLQLPVVLHHQLNEFPLNTDVQQQVALMMTARAKKEAVNLVDKGDYDTASQILQKTRQQMLDYNLPMSVPEAAALEDLDQELQSRKISSYRKRSSHQSYSRGSRRSRGHSNLFYAFDRGPLLGDITQQTTDAIVNSTDCYLSDSGAIARAIHRAAGPELLKACQALNGCAEGSAKITPGFKLAAPWVIHTVCPPWHGGNHREDAMLAQCYRACLDLASRQGIYSIAFPAIGIGALGFPVELAARIAFETVSHYLFSRSTIGTVRFVCFDEHTLQVYEAQFSRFSSW
ncbi:MULTISPECIES: macro domain-containing protein [unclassified Leptolyngbya]|uniref:macro domain-containing protein n=1 Tax=unclassified Leptolyngbya TaxID=2650499 RepID=UPI001687B924|nr:MULTISPECIES: macro domain-containing protein [unclassified Leptolyngbya]MBD1913656.1 macro domain-containing protein [Leptolyngbya sp. FACHB-8]MBD2158254.1 macro domain-containing protein [Leptolyngbya sp. FACHB-16]